MLRALIFSSLLFSSSALACPMADAAAFAKAAEAVQQSEGEKASFKLEGLTCGSCSDKVSSVLSEVKGIVLSAVDYQSGRVEVSYTKGKTDLKKIEEALASTGYKIVERPKS